MIALSVALVVVAILATVAALAHIGVRDEAHKRDDARCRESIALERERFEASRPLPPHEELVAKVAELERRVGGVETWAKR